MLQFERLDNFSPLFIPFVHLIIINHCQQSIFPYLSLLIIRERKRERETLIRLFTSFLEKEEFHGGHALSLSFSIIARDGDIKRGKFVCAKEEAPYLGGAAPRFKLQFSSSRDNTLVLIVQISPLVSSPSLHRPPPTSSNKKARRISTNNSIFLFRNILHDARHD